MKIHLASHFGMCFGVRDAIATTEELASKNPTTVLGELVHNPIVTNRLSALGVKQRQMHAGSLPPQSHVVVTAHGASDNDRKRLIANAYRVTDTTCPLVHKAHRALASLVAGGYHPIVIGQPGHVEVKGLVGDFPAATVFETEEGIADIPPLPKLGIVAQTTQPIDRVRRIVERVKLLYPKSDVEFRDTVCQPTKDRQQALQELCSLCETVIVVGGSNSNNTKQLVLTARSLGSVAQQVESADDLEPSWFESVENVGVTAGTSTLPETVHSVCRAIERFAEFATLGSVDKLATEPTRVNFSPG